MQNKKSFKILVLLNGWEKIQQSNFVISGNILVTSGRTIGIKLSDFDLSKILDPDASTSGMSSNVGTPAFKAPEYFQFFEQNKQRENQVSQKRRHLRLGVDIPSFITSRTGPKFTASN